METDECAQSEPFVFKGPSVTSRSREHTERVIARHAGEPERFGELRRGLESARQNTAGAGDLASLLGIEGSGTRAYFDAVMGFNRSGMEWPGRVKFPATDPVNALLSFGYTLVCQELAALLEGHGLDPYLGFYHQPDFGRRSLALDLTEAFRHPVVDRLVLALLNRRSFQREDFTTRGERGGVYLNPEALKRFFEFYERWMLATGGEKRRPSFRKVLGREAAEFVKSLRKEMEFQPFRWAEAGDEGEEELWNTLSVTI